MQGVLVRAHEAESARLESFVKKYQDSINGFVKDYSHGSVFSEADATKVSADWVANVKRIVGIYEVNAVWVFDKDLRVRASILDSNDGGGDETYFLQELRSALVAEVFGHYYYFSSGSLWELAYAPIQPSTDIQRVSAPQGYVVAIRKWGPLFLEHSGESIGTALSIVPFAQAYGKEYIGDIDKGLQRAAYTFVGRSGDNLAVLDESRSMVCLATLSKQLGQVRLVVIAGIPALFLLTWLAGYMHVGKRIRKLVRVMKHGDAINENKGSSDYRLLAQAVQAGYAQLSSALSESITKGSPDKLMQRERLFGTILRHINGIVLVITRDGILTVADGSQLDSFGMSKERDEGRPITSILRGQERLSQFESALQGKRSSQEQKVGERIFLTMCEPLPGADGGTDSIVVLALDITDKRLVEETLVKAKQDAERADRIKTQFLSVMSHETSTPLNGLLRFASVLRETPLNEENVGYLDRIVESGQNLLRLLTDILDLARLEAGEGRKNLEPISLTALVYQFAERYRIACQQKGRIEFDLDIDQRMPDFIESDNEMLSRILSSLLDNAVKFTDVGKVKFSVEWVVKDRDGKSGVQFKVSDTGPGITPDIARNVFTPFSQGDSSNTRRHGGLGLGLTIAHRLATQLDGRLTFDTKLDVGTTFTLFLPTRAMDEAAARKFAREG